MREFTDRIVWFRALGDRPWSAWLRVDGRVEVRGVNAHGYACTALHAEWDGTSLQLGHVSAASRCEFPGLDHAALVDAAAAALRDGAAS